ncbi:MAG: DUF1592 domain-containing protein [Deltaproteobacteria bacterium]|nr:DUF1592 domain-containing protein [Kofleriaceae bacterium]
MAPARTRTLTWLPVWIVSGIALSSIAGCWGSISDPGNTGGECGLAPLPAPRRLSHTEYRNTVRDLFPTIDVPELELVADPTPLGFDNDGEAMQPSPLLVNQYNVAANEIAQVVRQRRADVVACSPTDGSACGAEFIAQYAPRAYRRPLAPSEQAALQQVFDAYLAQDGFDVALELTTQVILQSPAFLYRVETIGPDRQPSAYDTASRLSYLLWSTMPDDALFAAAAAAELQTPAQLEAQVDRMLADPRALEGFMVFASQWLDLARLDYVTKLPADGLTSNVREALREEAQRFLQEIIWNRGGTVSDLLLSSRAFVSAETAAFYGLPAPAAGTWEEVDLPAERRGFLMQAQFLASHGHPNNPSPVLRGLFVLKELMCVSLGSPPAGVDMSIPEGDPEMGPTTNRDNYERVTGADLCRTCHSIINPVGFTFERFDTMGRLRDTDNGLPIDTSGSITGVSVADANALVEYMAGSAQVSECVTRKYMTYALNGGEAIDDACLTRDIAEQFEANGGSLRGLMRSIAVHPRYNGIPQEAN